MINFFHPSAKLQSKHRDGAKLLKRYDQPQTPCQRVLAHPLVSEELKAGLRAQMQRLNPFELKRQILRIQGAAGGYRGGEGNGSCCQPPHSSEGSRSSVDRRATPRGRGRSNRASWWAYNAS
jgi:hypothetical protein